MYWYSTYTQPNKLQLTGGSKAAILWLGIVVSFILVYM